MAGYGRTPKRVRGIFLGAAMAMVILSLPVRAEEHEEGGGGEITPDHKTALAKQVKELKERYREMIITGKDDQSLKMAVNQIDEAVKSGDWGRVRTLLDSVNRPVVESTQIEPGAASTAAAAGGVVVEERKISYKSGELLLSAIVYVPSGGDKQPPFPGVLYVHNNFLGAGLAERTLAREVAARHYIVMVANLRGYGRDPGRVTYALDEVEDTIAAIGALKAIEGVDAEKVAVFGDRHGANCVLLAAARVGGAVSLVIAANPYPKIGDALKDRGFRRVLGQVSVRIDSHKVSEVLPRSPFYNLQGLAAKVVVFYGKRNSVVSDTEIERYMAVMEARKVSATLKEFYTVGDDLADNVDVIKKDLIQALEDVFRPKKGRTTGRRTTRH
ncbi:MAG: hypothetical protein JW909_10890 [Planctomycetes bacterium]|nr:hypothetical protein [Planctomycetota bacterium]